MPWPPACVPGSGAGRPSILNCIPMAPANGGRLAPAAPDPLLIGTSVCHSEGNTAFVVETIGFNEKTWLDRLGHAHSDQLKVTERFRRIDRDHLELDITMTDPKALAKPWSTTFFYQLRPNWEMGEISCSGDYLDFPGL